MNSNKSRELASGASHQRTRQRFGTEEAAARYARKLAGSRRDRREKRCILAGLEGVPSGAAVLDLPCGTGRLTSMLVERGFLVIGADSSAFMVSRAQAAWREASKAAPELEGRARFEVQDVLWTRFRDGEFDAVVSNRLLHHFLEPETRIAALRELGRVCSGPLVVSFFNSFAFDALLFRARAFLSRKPPADRVPISLGRFRAEAEEAGLRLERALPTRWAISPQWYAVLRRGNAS